ncbi:NADH:ubiquinone reductase (Na(+)-transporting) subunit C [Woeseia oceani]|uniref:Na(+)-translocating NADH-quinone reductase subunit C n=1 Tax=Woeseia oceani TaxID=1548547 RepID=A0A193LD79_9GAMM|nr:NADH:ubiquinone reductase (Na(+)-transporting) subunit C [Woeseia oceani]ANO50396.1 NADH:ubiquinone reductase (Na(+)-transporting) subunit C [Woeseia oceani]
MNVDTVPRTLLVATLIALICSVMVAAAVDALRPVQEGYQLLDRNRSIVEAAGRLPSEAANDREIISNFLELEAHVVELRSGQYLPRTDAHTFDHWADPRDEAATNSSSGNERVPVYIVRRAGKIERIVLPVHGPGMWDTIYAYIALAADFNTVQDLVIYKHGETPAIGDRIEDPEWLQQWQGKRIYDEQGEVRISVSRRAEQRHGVDLISGASITSDAVGTLVAQWFGADGYKPYLDRLRQEASN